MGGPPCKQLYLMECVLQWNGMQCDVIDFDVMHVMYVSLYVHKRNVCMIKRQCCVSMYVVLCVVVVCFVMLHCTCCVVLPAVRLC